MQNKWRIHACILRGNAKASPNERQQRIWFFGGHFLILLGDRSDRAKREGALCAAAAAQSASRRSSLLSAALEVSKCEIETEHRREKYNEYGE